MVIRYLILDHNHGLHKLGTNQTQPWACFGDFNELLYEWEKHGGNDQNSQQMSNFREPMDSVGMCDLGFHRYSFTWCNGILNQ